MDWPNYGPVLEALLSHLQLESCDRVRYVTAVELDPLSHPSCAEIWSFTDPTEVPRVPPER